MREVFDKRLMTLLNRLEAKGLQEEIPVIVTIKPETDLTKLESKGLKIGFKSALASIVSGTIPSTNARKLAELNEVEKIEYDAEMHAIEQDT